MNASVTDFVLFAILGGLLLGLLAFVIGIIVIIRNIRRNRKMPVEHVMVTVENNHKGPMDKGYHVRFWAKSERITLDVGRKRYFGFSGGDKGELVYQGYKFISFNRTTREKTAIEPDFVREKKTGPTVLFYGEIAAANVNLPSDQRINVDLDDLKRLFIHLEECKNDWFFVLKRKDGKTFQVEIDDGFVTVTRDLHNQDDVSTIKIHDLMNAIEAFMKDKTPRRNT